MRRLELDPSSAQLTELIRRKLKVPGNQSMNVEEARFAELDLQLHTRLKSVLKPTAFQEFDLARAIRLIVAMAERLA